MHLDKRPRFAVSYSLTTGVTRHRVIRAESRAKAEMIARRETVAFGQRWTFESCKPLDG